MTIGQRMKELRGNLSQREAANRIGMTQQLWRVYEAGESIPGAKIIKKICESFGCKSDWLLGMSEEPSSIVAHNSAVVIGGGTAINIPEPGESPICRKCPIKKRLERIEAICRPK